MENRNAYFRRLAAEEYEKLTPAGLAKSRQFKKHLEARKNGIYRKASLELTANKKVCPTACTDGDRIVINTASPYVKGLKIGPAAMVSEGLLLHELGHILYTNFALSNAFFKGLSNGEWTELDISPVGEAEEKAWSELLELVRDKRSAAAAILKDLFNITEDAHIEPRMCELVPGWGNTALGLVRIIHAKEFPSVEKMIKDAAKDACKDAAESTAKSTTLDLGVFLNLLLGYAKYGVLKFKKANAYTDKLLSGTMKELIQHATLSRSAKVRMEYSVRILLEVWEDCGLYELIKNSPSAEDFGSMLKGDMAPGKDSGNTTGVQADGECESITVHVDGSGNADSADSESAVKGELAEALKRTAEAKAAERIESEKRKEFEKKVNLSGNKNEAYRRKILVERSDVTSENMSEYERLASQYSRLATAISRKFDAMLKTKRSGYRKNLYMGSKLNQRAYAKGNGRIFMDKNLPDKRSIAVAVLIDESGSMSFGKRIVLAKVTAMILYEAFDKAGIPAMFVGHDEDARGNVRLWQYSDFDSVCREDKYRLMNIAARCNNRDGTALRAVCQRLEERSETFKLVFVISDGSPQAMGYCGEKAEKDVRNTKEYYARRGLHVFAAAIGDDKPQIERCYGSGFLDISDVEKLPSAFLNIVSQYLRN